MSIFRLLLQVECLCEDPIIIPIEVRSGTTLRLLKTQVRHRTNHLFIKFSLVI